MIDILNNNCESKPIEKVCIQTNKVFDACMKQITNEDYIISLTSTTPANPTVPLTFVSGRSLSSKGIISNLIVERLEDRPCFGRVQCDVLIPVEINYIDANNVSGTGIGNITIREDVVLYLPEPSIIPYDVEAVVSAVMTNGVFIGCTTNPPIFNFRVTACVTVILKIVIEVELIIPTYGYAVIPPCEEFTEQVCKGFFQMPLYPSCGKK